VVQFLVHNLPQLELFGGAQVVEGVLRLVEHLLFLQDVVPVLEGVF
jgi:hypothetical protein